MDDAVSFGVVVDPGEATSVFWTGSLKCFACRDFWNSACISNRYSGSRIVQGLKKLSDVSSLSLCYHRKTL